jgi:23S rRNA (guanosine2251-2'-O)-methyltransferase
MKPERSANTQIYGVLPVLEALRAGRRAVNHLTLAEGVKDQRLQEIITLARQQNIPLRRTPREDLTRLAQGANHQGVLATVAAARYAEPHDLLNTLTQGNEPALCVVLDGVEDPRNLGAIIRTAECAGAGGVFVPERRAVGLTETVAKASAGALEHLPVARVTNLTRLLSDLQQRGVWTVGTDANAATDYTAWDWTLPCAVVLGGEGAGLHRLVRATCDTLVRIPLHGQIASLNVSVAAGIVLYEARRQRQKK